MTGGQETRGSQRARRAAGWRWVAFYVPEQNHARIGQLASNHRLSREVVMQYALAQGLTLVDRREWYRLAKAEPFRMKRKDAGLCRECRARLKVGAEAQRQYQARKKRAEQDDGNTPEPPVTTPPETET
jgi:predicted transcriptional regulator